MTSDICATVKFKLETTNIVFNGYSDINILGLTTTPRTLPANTCLAVNNDIVYQLFMINDELYICSEFYWEKN